MLSPCTLLSLGVLAAQGVQAWGVLGHATVAYIAQHYVTADVARWAQGLLGDTSDDYLARIASWADTYRTTAAGKWSAPLHFIDAQDSPPTSCTVDYARDCGDAGCSISAIANYTQRLTHADRLSAADAAEALKFLVHIIGDLQQPLHDEAYKLGGNEIQVTFQNYSDNLHADWDTYLPQARVGGHSLEDAQTWAGQLVRQIDAAGAYANETAGWVAGDTNVTDVVATATRWARDANAYVCSVVMPDGEAALQQGDLYPDYYNRAIGTIELQIAKGGYRLAHWLNLVYASFPNATEAAAAAMPKRASLSERRHAHGERAAPAADDDLDGRQFLPAPRTHPSRAELARAAMDGGCGCDKHR